MSKSREIKCSFTSVWDDATITTPATYYPSTGEVSAECSDAAPEGSLEREYITLPEEEEFGVCTTCHSYVLKTVVGDRADMSYGEYQECSDPDCESHS